MDDCARLTREGREEEEEEEWGGTGVYIGVVGLPRTPRVSCRWDCQERLQCSQDNAYEATQTELIPNQATEARDWLQIPGQLD